MSISLTQASFDHRNHRIYLLRRTEVSIELAFQEPRQVTVIEPDWKYFHTPKGELTGVHSGEDMSGFVLGPCSLPRARRDVYFGIPGPFQPTTQPTICDVLYDFRAVWQSPRSCKLL